MWRALPIAGLSLTLLAAGCAQGPQRIGEENPRVSYSYDDGEGAEVRRDAEQFCFENYSRDAVLVSDVDEGSERVATFECVRAS